MRDFHQPGRSAVFALNGMCATSHPLAAKTAVSILESGGNAVDAAIGAAVLLGIAEPQMTGIGGDCFVLIKPAGDERIVALNGSGRAPAGLHAAELRDAGHAKMPTEGALCATVPGAIDAFCKLSADYGLLGLDAVLAPAIDTAENGIPVAPRVAFDWAKTAPRLKGAAARHFLPWGHAPDTGAVFSAPGQAEVLRRSPPKAAPGSMKARWPKTWSPRCRPPAAPTRLMTSRRPPATTRRQSAGNTSSSNWSSTRPTVSAPPPS